MPWQVLPMFYSQKLIHSSLILRPLIHFNLSFLFCFWATQMMFKVYSRLGTSELLLMVLGYQYGVQGIQPNLVTLKINTLPFCTIMLAPDLTFIHNIRTYKGLHEERNWCWNTLCLKINHEHLCFTVTQQNFILFFFKGWTLKR